MLFAPGVGWWAPQPPAPQSRTSPGGACAGGAFPSLWSERKVVAAGGSWPRGRAAVAGGESRWGERVGRGAA